jgi:hypothetical protein
MPAVEITAALIGAAATAAAAAAPAASELYKNSRGNLATTITVFNGTQYPLAVSRSDFRKGAFFGGTEGEFSKNPEEVLSMDTNVFGSHQIQGATTDVIGYVLYTCEVFDLIIGWHVFDQAGIQRYITSAIKPPGTFEAKNYFGKWDADLTQPLNKLIWSGGPNTHTSKNQTMGYAIKVNGTFERSILDRSNHWKSEEVTGNGSEINFVTRATGGAKDMQVLVVDEYVTAYYKGDEDDADHVSTVNL